MKIYDVAIIGAGIAGASLASEIAGHCAVLLLEAEAHPGYHATGRSAAFWTETYGGPKVQPLTSASRAFLEYPAPEFSDHGFLKRRGALNIALAQQTHLADKFIADFEGSGLAMERWDGNQLASAVPRLKPNWTTAVYEPDCFDIDVGGLHSAYLRRARQHGASLQCRSRVASIQWREGVWQLQTNSGQYKANKLVNAAGAWADEVAGLAKLRPLGITPMRRTMVQLQTDPPSHQDGRLIVALDGSFYFKPEAGGSYWLSPHDEIESPPVDAAPEELDVAIAIDRFEKVLDVEIISITHKWAGLRSFAPDRLPVYGFDAEHKGFFWFAGQGGFGIQTAPAAARLAKALILEQPREEMIGNIDAPLYSAARFR